MDDVDAIRCPPGPGLMAKYQYGLSAFDGLDLSDNMIDHFRAMLVAFARGVRLACQPATSHTSGTDAPADTGGWE